MITIDTEICLDYAAFFVFRCREMNLTVAGWVKLYVNFCCSFSVIPYFWEKGPSTDKLSALVMLEDLQNEDLLCQTGSMWYSSSLSSILGRAHYIALHCGCADVNTRIFACLSAMYIILTLLHWLCLCTWRLMLDGRRRSRCLLPCCHLPAPSLGSPENQAEENWICYLAQSLPAAAGLCSASGRMPVGKDDCRLPVHTLLTQVPQS